MTKEAKLILYSPHEAQMLLHQSDKRYRIGVFGRQSGKSTWGNQELLKKAWENPNTTYWFISPTFDQAKEQYRRLVGSLYACPGIMLKKNQTELRVKLINQSSIVFKSGDNYENLRGATLHGVVIDEVRDQAPDLWPMVIRPMLATTEGWGAFISTPNGFDSFYDLVQKAKASPDLWDVFHAPSTCNPLFTQEEFDTAKKDMGAEQFRQEILAEFTDLTAGRAYTSFGEWNNRAGNPFNAQNPLEYSPYLPIHVFLDFNLSPMHWMIAQLYQDMIHVEEEIYFERTHSQYDAPQELIARLKRIGKDTINKNGGVILVGDATGKATQRTSHQSDYDVICMQLDQAQIKWQNITPESNPAVKDRVTTVNTRLKNATGYSAVTINFAKCPLLVKDLQRVTWKQTEHPALDSGPDGKLTHGSDAMGYGICKLLPIELKGAVGVPRVVLR